MNFQNISNSVCIFQENVKRNPRFSGALLSVTKENQNQKYEYLWISGGRSEDVTL